MERKQEGIEYSIDENNNVIMTFTDYKTSYMLKDGIDPDNNNEIVVYFIPQGAK